MVLQTEFRSLLFNYTQFFKCCQYLFSFYIKISKNTLDICKILCYYMLRKKKCAPSSADRVPGYEPVGRGFESPQARQQKPVLIFKTGFLQ